MVGVVCACLYCGGISNEWLFCVSYNHSKYLEDNKFDDPYCLEHLAKLIYIDEEGEGTNSSTGSSSDDDHFKLADIQSITEVLRDDRIFSFELLQEKIVRTIVRLDRAVYGEEPSILIAKKYRFIPPPVSRERKRQQDEAQLAVLHEERKRLRDNGEDPLAMALEKSKFAQGPSRQNVTAATEPVASQARSPGKPTAAPAAVNLLDDDDDWLSEQDDDEKDSSERRSVRPLVLASPKLERLRGMIRKQTCEADEGIFDENGRVKSRRAWTAAEDAALKRGIELHGVGKWKKIKEEFADILHNRQTVQIKDRHRTLVNAGDL